MKTVFITGANRGLGKGFVEYLLNEGFTVFGGARNPEDFDPKLLANKNFTAVKIDVSNDEQIQAAFNLISQKVNTLDYLINNAGLNKDSATNRQKELVCKLEDLDRASLIKMFDVNTISPLILLKIFKPLLNSTPSFVVNISSARGSYHDENENNSGNYGYRSSKTALNMMTYCSLFDLPENIKTYTVHPGSVKTDMNPIGEALPIEQAERILSISKDWKEEFNGRFLRYDGTIYPL